MADLPHSSFPAPARSLTVNVDGRQTAISTISFTEKLLFTITQTATLAHWVHVPMNSGVDTQLMPQLDSSDSSNDMLPAAHLTATTVLGGTRQGDDTFGQMLASTIASSILLKRPDENRLLVLGLGLWNAAAIDKAGFDELLGAILTMI